MELMVKKDKITKCLLTIQTTIVYKAHHRKGHTTYQAIFQRHQDSQIQLKSPSIEATHIYIRPLYHYTMSGFIWGGLRPLIYIYKTTLSLHNGWPYMRGTKATHIYIYKITLSLHNGWPYMRGTKATHIYIRPLYHYTMGGLI
jgi:hypothetical protein